MSENRTSIFDFRRGLSVWAIWDKIVYISLLVSWQFYCICLPCVRFKDSVGLQMIPRSTTKQIRSDCPATAPKFGKFQSWILNFFFLYFSLKPCKRHKLCLVCYKTNKTDTNKKPFSFSLLHCSVVTVSMVPDWMSDWSIFAKSTSKNIPLLQKASWERNLGVQTISHFTFPEQAMNFFVWTAGHVFPHSAPSYALFSSC